ncbi:aminopeptidase [Klebsiella pneumoniae]|uniref:Aminopeptidase n=1 Tax=Klebsiella pneumoniae TaxID=573 RepID=A0A923END6_KLEPN|nr:aminopeptidase [Klebsiella pneumoniae]
MGYQSDVRSFNTRYIFTDSNQRKNWHNATGSTVIAAHEGKVRQQIIIMAHLDTYAPQSDKDVENNLGGLTLQGIDDNAMGLGVLLELAEHLKNVPTRYGIRFIATSGEEEGRLGAQNLLQRMSEAEKKNTLLVINLDNLVVGDKLLLQQRPQHAGLGAQADPRSRAGYRSQQGHRRLHQPGLNPAYPKGTSCCNDASVFDNAGIPVLSVEATNWSLGKRWLSAAEQIGQFPAGNQLA